MIPNTDGSEISGDLYSTKPGADGNTVEAGERMEDGKDADADGGPRYIFSLKIAFKLKHIRFFWSDKKCLDSLLTRSVKYLFVL